MLHRTPIESTFLPLQFKRPRSQSWWAPVWRGLVVDETGKHYGAMRSAIWLYLYLVIHADRSEGTLFRKISTIAQDMGCKPATIRRWLAKLSAHNYISRNSTGRALRITVERWKRLRPRQNSRFE